MNLTEAVFNNYKALRTAATASIDVGVGWVWSVKKPPQEPDIVAGLVLRGLPEMAGRWNTILGKVGIRMAWAAVFCHQRPYVRDLSLTGGCELGDLLVVHSHKDVAGETDRNALLLQAKMGRSRSRLSSSDLIQLGLYKRWPTFEFTSPAVLKGESRNVEPKMRHRGAQYLLLDEEWPSTIPEICMADRTLIAHGGLDDELVQLLLGLSGRPFASKAESSSTVGWSRVVWDLLQTSFRKSFSRPMLVKPSRYSGDSLIGIDGC